MERPGDRDVASSDRHAGDRACLRFDTDTWATDLARVLDRATGEKLTLDPDVLARIAAGLLHEQDEHRVTEAAKARLNEHGPEPDRYAPDFTVERWADDLDETIRRVTGDQVRLSRAELRVAANLFLHGRDDDWVPQASLLREQAEPAEVVEASS